MIAEEAIVLDVGGAVLEARLGVPPSARGGLIACHPHPLYGGDMDNPVVVRAVEVAAEEGLATLRFNFRGVGASTGTHGGGHDERRDVGAAVDRLRQRLGAGVPVRLAGYSFGATVAAGATVDRGDVDGLALIAPPLAMTGRKPFLGLRGTGRPLLIVAGSQDEYCPRAEVEGLAAELPGASLEIVEGATHFFLGKLFPLGEALRRWVRS